MTNLTNQELITLRKTRLILRQFRSEMYGVGQEFEKGIVHEAADAADDALFNFLNVVHNWLEVPVPDEFMNTPEVQR